nr:uncharacterized protein LOC105325036 isoform X2 [Crassostrea gigas]
MKILLIFLVFTVSHRVLSQSRLVINTTCLELVKPSNQQFRLICSQYDYHCLLDETFTKEFEACREWKWIPGGKCAYFNTYGSGNVDGRECKPQINLTCSKIGIQFESKTNTQFTACYVKRGSSTPFTTTTSLTQVTSNMTLDGDIEISSPASEVWVIFFLYIIVIAVVLFISTIFYIQRYTGKGLCIKDNTAKKQVDDQVKAGNEIESDKDSRVLFDVAFESLKKKLPPTEKFHDCVEDPLNNYDTGNDNTAKKQVDDQVKAGNEIESDKDSRVLFDVASESLKKKLPPTDEFQYCYEGQSNANEKGKGESGRNCNDIKERELPTDETDLNDEKEKPAGSITGSYHDLQQLENEENKEESTDIFDETFESLQQMPPEIAYPIKSQESSDIARNEDTLEQQPFLKNTPESPPTMTHEDENITEARRNDENIVKKQPVLGMKVEGASTSENLITMRQDDGNIAEARRSEKHQKGDSDGLRTTEVDSNTCKSAEVEISKDLKEGVSTADVQRKKLDEEKSAENATGLYIVSEKSDNEGDTQELTDVFDDTVESLQRIAHPTDEQDRELCTELYNLLDTEGLKLTQEVMTATISRKTGKPVKILLNNLTVQEKNKLKAMLPEESHRILESKTEHDTSIHVSYGLHRIILDEENSPKSGWGNPVREKDIGIGDDVERLNRIHTIVQGISNPVTVSVESYIRLLDIMIKTLIRLDPDAKFKEDYKLLSYKLNSIKNPNLTQTMLKTITDAVKKIW